MTIIISVLNIPLHINSYDHAFYTVNCCNNIINVWNYKILKF